MDEAIPISIRATAYELLAFTFRYPGPELAEAAASGEWADAAREVAEALALELPEGWGEGLAGYGGRDAGELLHALRAEATRLFVGAPEPAVSPYEGVWRATDDGVQALLFVNPHSMEVERFMKSCGVGRPEGTNEPLDCADAELEFLQYLASLELEAVREGDDEAALKARRDSLGFLQSHLLSWIDDFRKEVEKHADTSFYLGLCEMTKGWLEIDEKALQESLSGKGGSDD